MGWRRSAVALLLAAAAGCGGEDKAPALSKAEASVQVPSPSGPRLGALGAVPVLDRPGGALVGHLRLGATAARAEKPLSKEGCAGGWYPIYPRGVVCLDQGATLDLKHPTLAAPAPNTEAALPYGFARVKSKAALVDAAGHAAEELGPRAGVAVVGTATGAKGKAVAALADGRYTDAAGLEPSREVSFQGVELTEADNLPVAYVVKEGVLPIRLANGKVEPQEALKRGRVEVTGKYHTRNNERYWALTDGSYVRNRDITLIHKRDKMPEFVRDDLRWIDVSVVACTLVAYEGKKPVFATLVDTGIDRAGGSQATQLGTFSVEATYLLAPPGSGTFDHQADLRDAPWALRLSSGQFLAGAYWLPRFGVAHGPGHVLLSPQDAHRLWKWLGTEVPDGWLGAEVPEGKRAPVLVRKLGRGQPGVRSGRRARGRRAKHGTRMANDRPRYNPAEIEPKWQRRWEDEQTFKALRHPGQPKLYVLDMFPYPSGSGLHVGHPEGYTATDIVARYKRMRGFDVLHPMGWDAFGLPAEQHAIQTGEHPSINTANNIATFKRQLKSLGFSFDWSREVDTTDPNYVRWTQWIFLKLFERGLAFQSEAPVNWCAELGTVLANEEVIDGKSERGGYPVVRLPLRQWTLKITAYGDRLLSDLEGLDWPETKKKQEDWIGRSEGATVFFPLAEGQGSIEIFTTRPDTIFGATYMVLAPEHPLVDAIVAENMRTEVLAYRSSVASKSDRVRTESKAKTGVFTGAYAINPASGAKIPIWVADFVLASYGTGAIMSVPAHDERDFEFAKAFGLPIVEVVSPDGQLHDAMTWTEARVLDGVSVRSGLLDGKRTPEAKAAMIAHLTERGIGSGKVNYKLRDWVFSRQRYWGEPIPIYFPVELHTGSVDPRKDPHTIRFDKPIAMSEAELPLKLPDLRDYKPSGDPAGPLARALDWRYFERDGRWYARETNTMPQWAGSCWYYLRFLDPHNQAEAFSQKSYDDWMPVDLYVGGGEHAVLHLLYARFWHKVLFDCGYVKHAEPFTKLVHQGMILGEVEFTAFLAQKPPAKEDEGIVWDEVKGGPFVSFDEVIETGNQDEPLVSEKTKAPVTPVRVPEKETEKKGGKFHLTGHPSIVLEARSHKMSKARGNVVNPDEIVKASGADSLRVYEMFMGPLEAVKPWQTNGVVGVRRFLDKAFAVGCTAASSGAALDDDALRLLHKTVQKVTEDIEAMRFNTAVSALMILVNRLAEHAAIPQDAAEKLALLLSPFAPHLAEELWERLGHRTSLAFEPWPSFDPALVVDEVVEIAVQVNGKVRSRVKLRKDASEADARAAVATDAALKPFTEGKAEKKFLYVPGRIINVVVA